MNQPGGETPLPFEWGRGRGSDFAGSDVRWVHYLFSITETPTTNQGKRGPMSYIILFHWQPFKAIIYFSQLTFSLTWIYFLSFFFLATNLIKRTLYFSISNFWLSNFNFSHLISNIDFFIPQNGSVLITSTSTNTRKQNSIRFSKCSRVSLLMDLRELLTIVHRISCYNAPAGGHW